MYEELHEDRSIKPLLDNAIVEGNGTRWKTERWMCANNCHYYRFLDVGETGYRDALKKPSDVLEAIKQGKIKIINIGIPDSVWATPNQHKDYTPEMMLEIQNKTK